MKRLISIAILLIAACGFLYVYEIDVKIWKPLFYQEDVQELADRAETGKNFYLLAYPKHADAGCMAGRGCLAVAEVGDFLKTDYLTVKP